MMQNTFGNRGEWWVVFQIFLLPIALLCAFIFRSVPAWPGAIAVMATVVAVMLLLISAILAVGGVLHLGSNLTAVPRPLEKGTLVQTGIYGIVRHPIYAGIIFGLVGLALALHSLVGLGMGLIVFIFFDLKSRREETWLSEKYAGYEAYRFRVHKLIPFLY